MSDLRSRNLNQARSAYDDNDAAASVRAHSTPPSEGGHTTANDGQLTIVTAQLNQVVNGSYSGLILISLLHTYFDAYSLFRIIACFAITTGCVVFAYSSMNHSISCDVYDRERRREAWELSNYPKGEVDEIIELFESRGMSHEDATLAVRRMAKYDNFFVDLMMAMELHMIKPLPTANTSFPLRFVQEGLCYTFGVLFPFFLCLVLNALGQRVLFSLYNTKEAGAVLGFFPLPCFHLAYLLQVVFSLYHIQKSHKLKKANLLVHAFVVSVLSTLVCTSWMLF